MRWQDMKAQVKPGTNVSLTFLKKIKNNKSKRYLY